MSINNKAGWKETFTVANQSLELLTGMSRQGLDKARKALVEYGLIRYEARSGRQAGMYSLVSFDSEKVGTTGDTNYSYTFDSEKVGTTGAFEERNSSTLFKLNNLSTTTTEDEPEKISVIEAHKKAFGSYMMNALVSAYVMKLKQQGYTDAFLVELFLEVAESITKPSYRYLEEVGERWKRDKVYSRAQAKSERNKYADNDKEKVVVPFKREIINYNMPDVTQEELEKLPRG